MHAEKCRAYFERIGLAMPETITPDSALLRKIQYAHCTTVPYENLDILAGRPLQLEPDALFDKIVIRRRGGYCFELNGLLRWFLSELGYQVSDYMARYLRGESNIPMRRHRVLKVAATDGIWICDVGIGEIAPRWPIKMELSVPQEQFGETYKLEHVPLLGWVLYDWYHDDWRPFYSFTEDPQLDVDYIAPSFYCEKHPDSPFIGQEMVAIKTADGRITLDGHQLKIFSKDGVQTSELDDVQLQQALQAYFGLS